MYILFRSTQYFKSRFFGTLQKTLYRRFWKTLLFSHINPLKFPLFSSYDFSPCINVSQDIYFVWICWIFWRKKGCVSQNALNCVFWVHAFWCEKTIFCLFLWALDHTFNSNRSIFSHLLSIYFCRKKRAFLDIMVCYSSCISFGGITRCFGHLSHIQKCMD